MNIYRILRFAGLSLWLQIHLPAVAKAQQTDGTLNPQYVYKTWDNRNGLPQNSVFDMAEDKDGYLWIATEEGLVQFDGNDFKVINQENTNGLFSSFFIDITLSGQGGVWAASRNTVLLMGQPITKTFDLRDQVKGSWITAIAEDNAGRLWVGTNAGQLFFIQNNSVIVFPGWNGKSIQVLKSGDAGLLIGTDDGLFRLENTDRFIVEIDEMKSMDIRALASGPDGSLWIGTKEHGLFRKTLTRTTQFTEKDGLAELFIYSLFAGSNGDIWIGTSTSGVQIYSKGRFIAVNKDFSSAAIRCILESDGKLFWIGTQAFGLVQMKPADVHMLSGSYSISGKIILPIYEHPNGDIWVGTAGNGVNRISGGKLTTYTSADGIGHNLIMSIYGTHNAVFIGTANGLNRFDLKKGKIDRLYTVKDGLASNIIQCVFQDSDGMIWITTRAGGIHTLTPEGKIARLPLPAGLETAEFSSIFEDRKKNIWIGSTGSGLVQINRQGKIRHYSVRDGIPSILIDDIYEDADGALWLATDAGLGCFTNNKFTLFDKSNGLKSNAIFRIMDDDTGYLWLSGNFGLQRISLEDLKNLKNPGNENVQVTVRLFNRNDGMANDETNGGVFPAGWKMKNGDLWFPTIEGIAIVKPKLIDNRTKPVNIHIQSIAYGDKKHPLSKKIMVPPGVYNIEIDYSSVDFTSPHSINYYYRLKGLYDEWKEAGNRRTAYITSLNPGEYIFEVKAEKSGVWSETASLLFEVKPFFHQTIWFKFSLVIMLFFSGFIGQQLYSKYREGKKLKSMISERNRELEKTFEVNKELDSFSYSISHDLRAPLRSINGYTHILMEDYENLLDEQGRKALHSIKYNSLRMGQLIEDLLLFSHLGKQDLRKVSVNMQAVTETVLADLKEQYNEVCARVTVKPLVSIQGDRSMLTQVMTNLVSNALKYSGKKEKPVIEIGSFKGKENIIFYVKDNGVGFDMQYYNKLFGVFQRLHSYEDYEGTGVGLSLVHRIITKHGGKVWAEGKVNAGATFYFSLPGDDKN